MNKFGFISSLLTLVLLFLQFLPIGIQFGVEGNISIWLCEYCKIETNPWFKSHVQITLELFHNGNQRVFLWGILNNNKIQMWNEIHLFGFILLFVFGLLAGFLTLFTCAKETKGGKKFMSFNFFVLLIILLFIIIGIPIYSKEILGEKLDIFDIFNYLNFGFYVLLLDFILAAIAYGNHPIKEG